MRPVRLAAAALGLAAVLAAAGCGDAAGGGKDGEDTTSSSADGSPTSAAQEQITEGGLAALVADHLGKDAIARFVSYGPEPGQVYVMVRLRGSGRADMFSVSVMSPKQGGRELAGAMGKCPTTEQRKRMGWIWRSSPVTGCKMARQSAPTWFRPDSATTTHAVSSSPESPSRPTRARPSPCTRATTRPRLISVADVDKLLSDPRMTWMTDPATNKAGNNLKIEKLRG